MIASRFATQDSSHGDTFTPKRISDQKLTLLRMSICWSGSFKTRNSSGSEPRNIDHFQPSPTLTRSAHGFEIGSNIILQPRILSSFEHTNRTRLWVRVRDLVRNTKSSFNLNRPSESDCLQLLMHFGKVPNRKLSVRSSNRQTTSVGIPARSPNNTGIRW